MRISQPFRLSNRTAAIAAASVLAVASTAYAAAKLWRYAVDRDPQHRENRMNVIIKAPYGSVGVYGNGDPNLAAIIETKADDEDDPPPMHYRYLTSSDYSIGTLRITLGSDDGMLQRKQELAQGTWASNGRFTLTGAGTIQTDGGTHYVRDVNDFYSPVPSAKSSDDYSRVFLNPTIPINLWAETGFGESVIDISGLAVVGMGIQNQASKSRIVARTQNRSVMEFCNVNAGLGECTMDGICNYNVKTFKFTGGIGYYELNFTGTMQRDLDANVEVGCGKVVINIPPGAARVQAFYDDNLFSSFSFSGLNKRRDGYYTSVGFDQSRAPILTLRLSTGVGKMVVSYR
ncbi:MAG: hypothetical protein JSS75_13165 [Bacteroidetes bacterium]|nr:hypothetical protein [Bacteroidota bacterium]